MKHYDVIIVGGSYAGLSAGMALGRALRNVLIIDAGQPCNIQTPHSHNFLTRDGETPEAIAAIARKQVLAYPTIELLETEVTQVSRGLRGFEVVTHAASFMTGKLIFATGIQNHMPDIPGFTDCWGISVLHCPYCHGYEIRDTKTAVLGNGDAGFEFARFIRHWTARLTLLTNGPSSLTDSQIAQLSDLGINVIENEVTVINHTNGQMTSIGLRDRADLVLNAMYARLPFGQKSEIPAQLGCEIDDEGYLVTNGFQKTTVPGVYAAGDCTNRMRSVSNAVASGTTAGAMVNHELIQESFAIS